MQAHLCQGGDRTKGLIRKYPSFLCSMCMGRNAVEIDLDGDQIDKYNSDINKILPSKRTLTWLEFKNLIDKMIKEQGYDEYIMLAKINCENFNMDETEKISGAFLEEIIFGNKNTKLMIFDVPKRKE